MEKMAIGRGKRGIWSLGALAVLLTGAVLTLGACDSGLGKDQASKKEQTPATQPAAGTVDKLEPYECGTIERLHTAGGVFLASQPSVDDFRHAKEAGIKTVINMRKEGELKDFDQDALMTELGFEYHKIGFRAPEELTDQVFDSVRAILNDQERLPILLHCSSGNRVGAVWLAHRVLDRGMAWEDAVAEAKMAGMKLPAYEERAREYVAARTRS